MTLCGHLSKGGHRRSLLESFDVYPLVRKSNDFVSSKGWRSNCPKTHVTTISHILFPVDFSHRCVEIIPLVKEFASKYNAEIQLLHVVNPLYLIPETGISGPGYISKPEWQMDQSAQRLNELANREFEGYAVTRLLYEGDVEAQITGAAKEVQLIIMPTHGYGVFRKTLLGSVTAKVLNDVSCPVLTGIHFDRLVRNGMTTKRPVVCAIDLSPQSVQTLTYAVKIAADFESTLSIVHAIPQVHPNLHPMIPETLREGLESLVRENIRALQISVGAANSKVCIHEGDIPKIVCGHAKAVDASLIIISRGNQQENGRLRTNSYGIIRQSPCPVLSV